MNKETMEIVKYINKMFIKIKETSKMLNGNTDVDGGFFGYIEDCIFDIILVCLRPVIGNKLTEDEFNNLAVEIMYAADENELNGIMQVVKNQKQKD